MNAKNRQRRHMYNSLWHSARIILSAAAIFIGTHLAVVETAKGADVDYIIHVVFDGLRSDVISSIGPTGLPNVYRMINEGAWTENSRADYDYTETLPNHTDMLTSRPVTGSFGHGVSFNVDNDSTVHAAAKSYVTSVFDVVHDNGMRTGLYASKGKFSFFDRSWNESNGRPDTIGVDNGRDKIDVYLYNNATPELTDAFITAMTENPFHYAMISLWNPDAVGHGAGWMSSNYKEAVQTADGYLGQIFSMVENSPMLNGHTIVLLMSDHGGTGYSHGTATDIKNYKIPFLVWGAGVKAGGDLYSMNSENRSEPEDTRPDNKATPQPIRSGDSANLATQMLGLETVAGSLFNSSQDLAVSGQR